MDCSSLLRAHNSAVECHLHTVEVVGSNPAAPTIESITYMIAVSELGSIKGPIDFEPVVGSGQSSLTTRLCA
jgi:hypothetical protein